MDRGKKGKRYKICYILMAVLGGAQEHLTLVLKSLNRESFDITLILDKKQAEYISNSEIFHLNNVSIILMPLAGSYNLKGILYLYKFFKRKKFDIVHTHTSKADVIGSFAAFLARVPVRVSTIHAIFAQELVLRKSPRLHSLLYLALLQIAYILNTDLICVSNAARKSLAVNPLISSKKVFVIYHGYEPKFYSGPPIELPEQLSTFATIAYVGRISPEKGLHVLIEAVNILKENAIKVAVVVLGECSSDTYMARITNMLNRYGIEEQFYFAGFVKRVSPWIVHADMLVVPSLIETFCLAVLDGWHAQKPIVAPRTGGVPEVVTNGSNGLLFEPGSYYELSGKIKYLLTHQKDAERMGRSGYLTLKKRFAHDKMVRKTEAIYFNHNIPSGIQAD